MSGLDTPADEGLDLQLLETSSKAELIEWHPDHAYRYDKWQEK